MKRKKRRLLDSFGAVLSFEIPSFGPEVEMDQEHSDEEANSA
jgi:hypothetical protein